MQQTAPVTPDRVFETFNAYQKSAALKTAVDLNLFTNISEGSHTTAEIAAACGASERGIRMLCDFLTVLEFLQKENGRYDLTEISAVFLDRNSQAYCGDAALFLTSDKLMEGFATLTEAVRQGGSAVSEEGSLDPESPMWVKFAKGMTGMMMHPAQKIAENLGFDKQQPLKVLDIAAGHGIFGITIAREYPKAEIYALDWANVLEVATENAKKLGVADRHQTISGSAFDVDYGDGYDVVLLTNFLHHFDIETCETLIRKIHDSLSADGKVLTMEFIPNDDRVSPPREAMFSLVMLAGTPAGDAYTFAELRSMFENSGFSRNEHIPLEPLPQHLVVSMK